jgi:hypothetical protein
MRIDKIRSLFDGTTKIYQEIVITAASLFAFFFILGAAASYLSRFLPHLRTPIGKRFLYLPVIAVVQPILTAAL